MSLRQPPNILASKAALLIVIISILLILVATLYPFNFSFQNGFSVSQLFSSFIHPSHLTDRVKNLLLFLPLGFSLSWMLQNSRLNPTVKLLIVLLSSAGLSFLVETLQYFLPSRKPTPADIFNNTFSGLLGLLCFYLWSLRIFVLKFIKKNKTFISTQKITLIFIGYLSLPFLISIPWQSTTNLSNWDLNFPLLLGNELTENRPWHGYVSEFYVTDRAISKDEVSKLFSGKDSPIGIGDSLIAYYQLHERDKYTDQRENLPDLIWQGQPLKATWLKKEPLGVFLSSRRWLETATPVTFLNQRIRESNQFTLGATVATAAILQNGPARIISVSSDVGERNLTLGQVGTSLIFRVRTPLSGDNGDYIQAIVPNVFTDNNPHQIVITYANSVLQVYVDNLENLHSFYLLELLKKADKFLYYGLIFIPLGYLLSLILILAQRRFIFNLLLYSGILLPPLLLELILATSSGRSIKPENLLLSVLITAIALLVFEWQLAWIRGVRQKKSI